MLSRWGQLDLLVNNAGVAYAGPTENMTAEQWQWLLSINLLAPIQFVRELLPVLKRSRESHIVNIASIYGLVAFGRFTAYNVSKFGLVGLSESLRAEYGRQGLGVSTICPGLCHDQPVRLRAFRIRRRPKTGAAAVLCTSPERVADKIIRAIYRDRRHDGDHAAGAFSVRPESIRSGPDRLCQPSGTPPAGGKDRGVQKTLSRIG